MNETDAPSREMVRKALQLNGLYDRFVKLLNDYPLLVALPHLVAYRVKGNYSELAAKHQNPAAMLDAFQEIYAKHFTADEILDYIAFLKTPVGRKLVEFGDEINLEMVNASVELAIQIAVAIVRENAPAGEENPQL
jgi:hypothetical protein